MIRSGGRGKTNTFQIPKTPLHTPYKLTFMKAFKQSSRLMPKENALHFNGIYVCECIEFMASKKSGVGMGLKKSKNELNNNIIVNCLYDTYELKYVS